MQVWDEFRTEEFAVRSKANRYILECPRDQLQDARAAP